MKNSDTDDYTTVYSDGIKDRHIYHARLSDEILEKFRSYLNNPSGGHPTIRITKSEMCISIPNQTDTIADIASEGKPHFCYKKESNEFEGVGHIKNKLVIKKNVNVMDYVSNHDTIVQPTSHELKRVSPPKVEAPREKMKLVTKKTNGLKPKEESVTKRLEEPAKKPKEDAIKSPKSPIKPMEKSKPSTPQNDTSPFESNSKRRKVSKLPEVESIEWVTMDTTKLPKVSTIKTDDDWIKVFDIYKKYYPTYRSIYAQLVKNKFQFETLHLKMKKASASEKKEYENLIERLLKERSQRVKDMKKQYSDLHEKMSHIKTCIDTYLEKKSQVSK